MAQAASPLDFATSFRSLAGNPPFAWQERLFHDHFADGKIPSVIDLPTGLGKTMVMAIWLIARVTNKDLPTRLIYVVDRRTVVDQATDLAERLVKNWKQANLPGRPPAISTLRGQRADNREWSRDPSRLAIIIGTVDLIGSALLFSGYRSSYKRRPLEAGLLGRDSLLVLDEAHLSKPFQKLLGAIEGFNKDSDFDIPRMRPMKVIRMSATTGKSSDGETPFNLQTDFNGNLIGEDARDAEVDKRFCAKKSLFLVQSEKPYDSIATEADTLARERPGSRIVVFVRTPKQVDEVRKALEKKNKVHASHIAQLTGTMRGLERDELVTPPTDEAQNQRRVMQRFLTPNDDPTQESCFLISTSAGEVGFDLNADHMVCDATTIDAFIQRLGRVNRRGLGEAEIRVVIPSPKADNVGKPRDLSSFELAISNTIHLLKEHSDLSPKNISVLTSGEWKAAYANACTPAISTATLTDILLDSWSMTSITEEMPGRPAVGPWLRGIDDEQAQTTIAWRAELDLFRSSPKPEKSLQAVFAKHSIRPHESLTVSTGYLVDFLKRIIKQKEHLHDVSTTRVAIRLPRGQVVCRTLQQLVDNPGILYADSTLVLPSHFGGLDAAGMLNADFISYKRKDGDPGPPSLDIADHAGYEQTDDARTRLRILIEKSLDGSWSPKPLPGLSLPDGIELQSEYDTSTELFNDLKEAELRVRLVQKITFDDEGEPVQSLVVLAPAPKRKDKEDQCLTDHVGAVERQAARIADSLGLAANHPLRVALLFAACWHDEGKKAEIWQRFVYGPDSDGQPKGKTSKCRNPKSLRGYRHEFGTLLRIGHPDRCRTTGCAFPNDQDALDIALHLIATHHGAGRPHFADAFYDPFTDIERDDLQIQCLRRFARLQKKCGWWGLAWLENLLRCADALASANEESTGIDEVAGGDI